MKRNPEVGDVVRIGTGKMDQLVISAHEEQRDGDSFVQFVFTTIPHKTGESTDPREKHYYMCFWPHTEKYNFKKRTKVDLIDIEFVCKAKFKEKIIKTFTVK